MEQNVIHFILFLLAANGLSHDDLIEPSHFYSESGIIQLEHEDVIEKRYMVTKTIQKNLIIVKKIEANKTQNGQQV